MLAALSPTGDPMTYRRILAAFLAAAALAGCPSLRSGWAGAGGPLHGAGSCAYPGAAAACRGLHDG